MVQRDPADIEEQRRLENSLEDAAIALEVAVLAIIARRLGRLENVPLVEVYASMPADIAEMQKAIREGSKGLQQTARNAIDAMASANDGWAAEFYAAKKIEQVPASEHFAMKEAIRRNAKAATDTIEVMCRSAVIGIIREDARGRKIQYTPLEEGYKQIVSEAASSMANGSKTVEQAVSQAVRNLSQNGLKVRYSSGNTRNLHSAVRMNVMDAYRTCMGELRDIQGREFGADGVEVSAHALSAPDHVEYQGMRYSNEPRRGYKLWDDVKRETSARPLETGANCVIEGTNVDVSGANVIFRRHYEGQVVRIRTSLGNDLTVTPNHPILTMRGWVAAKDIKKGDNVISGGIGDGVSHGVRPDIQHKISAIEYCFSSSSQKFDVFSLPSSSADFHGDGIIDEKVDVVFIDSELRGDGQSSISEQVVKSLLHDAPSLSDSSFSGCSFAKGSMGLVASPDSLMSSSGNSASLLGGHSGIHDFTRFASCGSGGVSVLGKDFRNGHFMNPEFDSDMAFEHSAFIHGDDSVNVIFDNRQGRADTSFFEPTDNDLGGNSDLSCDSSAGHSVFAHFDEVIDINVDSWCGHVYNLSTDCGYYLANGIITHNCGHMVSPVLLDISSPKYTKEELRDLKNRSQGNVTFKGLSGDELTMTRYEASQYQRRLETTIRDAKKDAYLNEQAKQASKAKEARAKASAYTAQYKRISKEVGLIARDDLLRLHVQK